MTDNRRVRMTKKMIKDATLELLEKHALEKITVTDICENADVNRSSFYAYYDDIHQLLLEIENDILNQIPISALPVTTSKEQFLITLENFFDYVQENERLFRIMIVQRDNSSFNHKLLNAVMEKYRDSEEGSDTLLSRYAYVYYVNGVIGIMKEWISEGFPITSRQFANIVCEMSAKAAIQ